MTSIRVYVNGEPIDEAPMVNEAEYAANSIDVRPVYGNGWSYESADNAVVFWGESIPDYNSDVRIYYRPLAGTTRPAVLILIRSIYVSILGFSLAAIGLSSNAFAVDPIDIGSLKNKNIRVVQKMLYQKSGMTKLAR